MVALKYLGCGTKANQKVGFSILRREVAQQESHEHLYTLRDKVRGEVICQLWRKVRESWQLSELAAAL